MANLQDYNLCLKSKEVKEMGQLEKWDSHSTNRSTAILQIIQKPIKAYNEGLGAGQYMTIQKLLLNKGLAFACCFWEKILFS